MLTDAVVLGLLAGWLRRGRISNLGNVSLRLWWLIILAFLAEAALPLAQERGEAYRLAGIYTNYLLLLTAIALNLDKRFFRLIGLGVVLNFMVIAANGAMPASIELLEQYQGEASAEGIARGVSPVHEPLTDDSLLAFLADVIPFIHLIPLTPSYQPWVLVSVGDVLMSVGLLLFLQDAMVARIVRKGKHRAPSRFARPRGKGAGAEEARGDESSGPGPL